MLSVFLVLSNVGYLFAQGILPDPSVLMRLAIREGCAVIVPAGQRTTPFFASYLNCCSGIVFCFAVRLWGGMIASVPRSSSPP